MDQAKKTKLNKYKKWIYLLVALVLLAVLIPQRSQLVVGLKTVGHADASWVIVAFGCLLLAYLTTATIYKMLSFKPISLITTFFVQVATSFTNRVIPAGLGGLGLNVDYLVKSGNNAIEAGSIVGVNSAIAMISHITLIVIALILGGVNTKEYFDSHKLPLWVPVLIMVAVLTLIILFISLNNKWKIKIKKTLKQVKKYLLVYKTKPYKIIFVYFGATIVTLLFVTALLTCSKAVGLQVSFVQAFICYTIGVVVGAATLTPGGIGGVEAGMYGALVAFNHESSAVFAAVILYRLVTYWIPIIPGLLCFSILRSTKKL